MTSTLSDLAGRTSLRLSALEVPDRVAKILPPPGLRRHRYHGVFAPNAPLRPLVTARTQEDNALAAQGFGPATGAPGTPDIASPRPMKPTSPAVPATSHHPPTQFSDSLEASFGPYNAYPFP